MNSKIFFVNENIRECPRIFVKKFSWAFTDILGFVEKIFLGIHGYSRIFSLKVIQVEKLFRGIHGPRVKKNFEKKFAI